MELANGELKKANIISEVLPELDSDQVEAIAILPADKIIETVELIKENKQPVNDIIQDAVNENNEVKPFVKTDLMTESVSIPSDKIISDEKKKFNFLVFLYDILN